MIGWIKKLFNLNRVATYTWNIPDAVAHAGSASCASYTWTFHQTVGNNK